MLYVQEVGECWRFLNKAFCSRLSKTEMEFDKSWTFTCIKGPVKRKLVLMRVVKREFAYARKVNLLKFESAAICCDNRLWRVYVTSVSNSELQCNLGNLWNKIDLCLYQWKLCDVSSSEVYWQLWTLRINNVRKSQSLAHIRNW